MPNKNTAIRTRLDFSKIPATIKIPNLIEVQKRSYDRFLQMDKLPSERDEAGLQSVFQSVFPISDFRNVSQVRPLEGPAPPAYDVQKLRLHRHHRPVPLR